MRKIIKLFKKPYRFFKDIIYNREKVFNLRKKYKSFHNSNKSTAILIGFSKWKDWMYEYLSDYNVIFLGYNPKVSKILINEIGHFNSVEVFVWSYKHPRYLLEFCEAHNISVTFVEDGFVRSIGLGVEKCKPLSLVFDKEAMHFDFSKPSELENILLNYDFDSDRELMCRAKFLLDKIRFERITKYNDEVTKSQLNKDLGIDKHKKLVLVLGQVEDDLSIKHGMKEHKTTDQMIRIAMNENPGALICYRKHPDLKVSHKAQYSSVESLKNICIIIPEHFSLYECFSVADKVYTMTSLAGFEAVLNGLDVKLLGCPFYAGWGFTEDASDNVALERRKRILSPLQVFAASYLLYPKYFNTNNNLPISAEDAINLIIEEKSKISSSNYL